MILSDHRIAVKDSAKSHLEALFLACESVVRLTHWSNHSKWYNRAIFNETGADNEGFLIGATCCGDSTCFAEFCH
jgi:hypothetical protein